jgi:hypothetical protein
METAASRKRQPRQKRWVSTKNPWTGRRERFEIAISDQGFREWEFNRVRLSASGFPDRPPEIDTAQHRGWNLYPELFDDEFFEGLMAAVEAAGL